MPYCTRRRFGDVDPAQEEEVNKKIADAKDRLAAVKEDVAAHTATLKRLQAEPTDADASAQLSALEEANKKRQDKLASLRGSGNQIGEVEKKKILKDYDTTVTAWRKRKRMCKNITDAVLENYPKSKKALYDDMGVETDEASGFDLATF